jgi:hypothetical protein
MNMDNNKSMNTKPNTSKRRTTKRKLSSTGLLAQLPWPSRAPTAEEIDLLLASWGNNPNKNIVERRRIEIDAAELISVLGPKFGASEMMATFAANKVIEIARGVMSGDPSVCMTEVMSMLVIGISAGIRLGITMERNDRAVSDSLNGIETETACRNRLEGAL